MDITSVQNPRIKQIVKLRDDRRQRQREGVMLVEGRDEIVLALQSGTPALTLIHAPEYKSPNLDAMQAELLTVSRPVFDKVSYRDNPDGWLAVFPIPTRQLDDLKPGPVPLLIVAEAVEKPGNLGAILRTADAAGVDALIVCDPRTDLYNPNVVRASRGTLFTVPTATASKEETLAWLRGHGLKILAATPRAESPYTAVDLRSPIAIIVGTEDTGLTGFWMAEADLQVQIPMSGKVNSLNVATATALIVYEAVRQRASIAGPGRGIHSRGVE